tara:strand:+ start:1340 stop:1684 length:345 start_codon:yes stop_codon:yes gene_type:complete
MIINLLLSLLTFNSVRYKQLNLNEPNAFIYPSKWDEYNGYDERFPKNETQNYKELNNINRYFILKKIINELEDCDKLTVTKMNILNKYSFLFEDSMEVDLKKGGLMDDYYFDIE